MQRIVIGDLIAERTVGKSSIGVDAKILVADDHEINRNLFKALLGQLGVQPTVVNNGAEAVLAWELGDWDVILMDVEMPEMDGVSATRLIRAKETESGRARTPIMAVTCNTSWEDAAAYRAAGMDDLVAKPIQSAALLAAMERAVRNTPKRSVATGYRTLHLEAEAVEDADTLATHISRELKRYGIAKSKTYEYRGALSSAYGLQAQGW